MSERVSDENGVNGGEGRAGWFPHSNVVHTAPVDQRIGPSSKPLEGAGFDPAFIPGLTAPTKPDPDPAEAPEDEAGPTEASSPAAPAPRKATEDTEDEAAPETSDAPDTPSDASEVSDATDASDESEESDATDESDGPVFEASDRRARIVADHAGIRLSLDEESCEFRWDEIGAVETESPRFGKRFTVTVHTPDRRWYPIEIEATARSRFQEWETRLDEVLDAYFQE